MTVEELARIVHDYRMAELEHHRCDSESSLKAMVKVQQKLDRCLAIIMNGQKRLFDD